MNTTITSATDSVLQEIRTRIESGASLIFLKSWEEQRWENNLKKLASESERSLTVWSATDGEQPALNDDSPHCSAIDFLNAIESDSENKLYLLKDLFTESPDPLLIRKLRDLAISLPAQNKTLLIISPRVTIPLGLQKEASLIDLPLPGHTELSDELDLVLEELENKEESDASEIFLAIDEREKILKAISGLTLREANRAINKSLSGKTGFDDDVITTLVAEKKQMLQGSDLLEFHDLQEGVDQVGGLEALKEWTDQRSRAYSEEAKQKGISQPKGVLLLGVQGCGKSLSARVIARQLSFPLVRLDFSALLSSGLGSSEQNLNEVLRVMDSISPAVLWIEEIEKGFAGASVDANADSAMTRMLGRFLTWLQEHEAPIFVVATANSFGSLPPELLRRGRFDEIFFIDLPNDYERQRIFKIHLEKRGINPDELDIEELADKTDGFSGAEIEQIVNSTIIECFTKNETVTLKALIESKDLTVPLSKTMEDEVFHLRQWARERCRAATPDSRVIEMLETEKKRGDSLLQEGDATRKWQKLAQQSRIGDALIEFVKERNGALLSEIQSAFEPYTTTHGSWDLALESDKNVLPWTGLSQEFAQLISKYILGRRLYLHSIDVNDYQKTGCILRIPAIQKLRKKQLPRRVWFPSKIKIIPPEEGTGRLGKIVAQGTSE